MGKAPLDPDVDNIAPTDGGLTVYDERHVVTYMRLLEVKRKVLTGKKSLDLYCTSTQSES